MEHIQVVKQQKQQTQQLKHKTTTTKHKPIKHIQNKTTHKQ